MGSIPHLEYHRDQNTRMAKSTNDAVRFLVPHKICEIQYVDVAEWQTR